MYSNNDKGLKTLRNSRAISKANQNYGQQQFIDHIFTKKKKWDRYQEILTNETKFDSSALLSQI